MNTTMILVYAWGKAYSEDGWTLAALFVDGSDEGNEQVTDDATTYGATLRATDQAEDARVFVHTGPLANVPLHLTDEEADECA